MNVDSKLSRIWCVAITRHILVLCAVFSVLPAWSDPSRVSGSRAQAQSVPGQLRILDRPGGFPLFTGTEVATICVAHDEPIVVHKAARLLCNDICRVTGIQPRLLMPQPAVQDTLSPSPAIVVGTLGHSPLIDEAVACHRLDVTAIRGGWEQFLIKKAADRLYIVGSDRRGTAYGVLSLSEALGVSPWYWWADVPVARRKTAYVEADFTSRQPSVKYRGIFINDEDWGLKPWAATNYERQLGDIGPKTYARVCELLLRLKANMLAPAMHPCTGAFYAHPDNKLVADTFGIINTTTHCEPLLLNNAAKSEWNSETDGEWNYETNGEAICRKWDSRLSEAARFENIYTVAMRGLHDTGLQGNIPRTRRVSLLEEVVASQRRLLEKHTGRPAADIPQIFVPYKETMDIYEDGLQVPDDVTLVWVDDNYGYMKRVASPQEQQRSGHSGVYYHLSYLGAPHDYLWLNTTPPALMYEELKKAYETGADRYWLLNVGDIKPMELGIQTFMDMAWNFEAFDHDRANTHQARFLAGIFGARLEPDFQRMLDTYYRLAWSRKPEFMGYEYQWDDRQHSGLRDTEFSFATGEAQQRLSDYREIAETVMHLAPTSARDAYFQLMEYPICAAYQMNRKFLMAQLNHELAAQLDAEGANWAARQSALAYDSIQTLNNRYNCQCDGKWHAMMMLPTGWCSLYQTMPPVTLNPYEGEGVPAILSSPRRTLLPHILDLTTPTEMSDGIRIIHGIGRDWKVVQLLSPTDNVFDVASSQSPHVSYTFSTAGRDSVCVLLSVVPTWPLFKGRGNKLGIAIDGGKPQLANNLFTEYSRHWKDQVMRNETTLRLRLPLEAGKTNHTVTLFTGDPGVMIQRIAIE